MKPILRVSGLLLFTLTLLANDSDQVDRLLAEGQFEEAQQIYLAMDTDSRMDLLFHMDYDVLFRMLSRVADLDTLEIKDTYLQQMQRDNYFLVTKAGILSHQAFLTFKEAYDGGEMYESVRYYYIAMYLRSKHVSILRKEVESKLGYAESFLNNREMSAYDSITVEIEQDISGLQVIVNCDTYCMINSDLKARGNAVRIKINDDFLINSKAEFSIKTLFGFSLGLLKNPGKDTHHYEGIYHEILQRPTDQGLLYGIEADYFITRHIGIGVSVGGFKINYDYYPFYVEDVSTYKFLATFPDIVMEGRSVGGQISLLLNSKSYLRYYIKGGLEYSEVWTRSDFGEHDLYPWVYKQLNHAPEKSYTAEVSVGAQTIQRNQKVYFATEFFYKHQFSPNTMVAGYYYGLRFRSGLVFLA